jgi:hypothetical protein
MPLVLSLLLAIMCKASGYILAGFVLQRLYRSGSGLGFGVVRTAVGLFVGATTAMFAWTTRDLGLSYSHLLPVARFLIWMFLVSVYFDPRRLRWRMLIGCAVAGTVWSYLLDILVLWLLSDFSRGFAHM